jgi:hypothetical protein
VYFLNSTSKLKDLIEKSTEKSSDGKTIVRVPTDSVIFSYVLEGIYTFQVKPKPEHVLSLMVACDEYGLSKFGEFLRMSSCSPGKKIFFQSMISFLRKCLYSSGRMLPS